MIFVKRSWGTGKDLHIVVIGALPQVTWNDLEELRERWFAMLPDKNKAKDLPEDQPFCLHAFAQSLKLIEYGHH